MEAVFSRVVRLKEYYAEQQAPAVLMRLGGRAYEVPIKTPPTQELWGHEVVLDGKKLLIAYVSDNAAGYEFFAFLWRSAAEASARRQFPALVHARVMDDGVRVEDRIG